jgi:quercetin dioxygenase-like cupin family protein
MKLRRVELLTIFIAGFFMPVPALAQQALVVKALASTKVVDLPAGPLYWRLENFPTLAQAQNVASPTSLAVQSGGKVWLITLAPAGGASAGGTKVGEVGPVPPVAATQYLLQVNEASGPPGSITPEHSHPGSETFYVLAGETSSRTPDGSMRVAAGHAMVGHSADTPMQVSSSGTSDLLSLVMFLVDANKPFSSPAKLP